MIRVTLLIPTLDRSGAEKQLTLLATRLPRGEFDVEVVSLTRSGPYAAELEQAGIPLTVLSKRWKFDPLCLRRLKRHLKERQPDVLHTWLFAANAYGRMALPRTNAPQVIVSERCVDSWKARWQLWLDRKLIPKTDLLVGNSQAVADFYESIGVPRERLAVVQNGIERPSAPQQSREEFRRSLGLKASTKLVGFVGRLAPQKRLRDLLWSFELLTNLEHEHVAFVIAGDGPQRRELEEFARNIRCLDRIRFLGHREDAASLISLFDVFWLASDFEGQSNSLMEAMASGVPCVVSDIAANVELITHEQTGLVVPTGDRAGFTKAADRLFRETEFARQLGQNAAELCRESLSVDRMVSEYARLYRKIGGHHVYASDDGLAS
ncbi:MAG: glycosyltransferase [Planctomycetota bacterium]